MNNAISRLYVVTAPSGTGKTSLVKALAATLTNLKISVSHTTRPKRSKEIDGKNYIFISAEQFKILDNEGVFVEKAKVFGYDYGTSREWMEEQLNNGVDVILEIDWQGAQQIRVYYPTKAITIFIIPPSKEVLEERLRLRGQDNEQVIQQRLAEVSEDVAHYHEFDYLIVNDKFDSALQDLQAIVNAQRLKTEAQNNILRTLIQKML